MMSLTVVFKAHSLDTSGFPVHFGIYYAGLDMKDAHIRIRKGQAIPETIDGYLGGAVRSEPGSRVEMCSIRFDLDSDRILRGVSKESLRDEQGPFKVLLNSFEELVAIYAFHGSMRSGHRGAVDQHVDRSEVARNLGKGCDHLVLVGDISPDSSRLAIWQLALD